MHLNKATTLLLMLLLSLSFITTSPVFAQQEVQLKMVADVTELGDPVLETDVIGATFSVAMYVTDTDPGTDMDLYGFDVQFNWSTQWVYYTGYEVTVPVDDYPGVQPPSPYAGILWADTMKLKEAVDEAGVTGGEPGTMAWIGYGSSAPAPSFNGSGTMFVFDFVVHNQPFTIEGDAIIKIHWTKTDISKATPVGPILHDAFDLEIPLWARKYVRPASPMLKVLPENIVAPSECVCKNFTVDIMLMGADGGDLKPYWDVAGCDFYLNFNATLIEAMDIKIDPDGDFGAFWSDGTFELADDINNDNVTGGWVHIAFFGIGTHTPVFGTIRVAEITFHMIYEHEGYPPPSAPIYLDNQIHDLKNPSTWYILHSEGGLIDMSAPVTTQWHTLMPYSQYCKGFSLDTWEDKDGDDKLSVGDHIDMTDKDTGKWHTYYVNSTQVTLNLTMQPFPALDDYVWPTDSWTVDGMSNFGVPGRSTAGIYGFDGQGHADWTGNFTLDYPFASVNSITANFVANGTSRVLTPGVDYVVHAAEQRVELLTPVDVHVVNEMHVDVNGDRLDGWPWIYNVATSFQSVYVVMPNGTERYSPGGLGCFQTPPPCEWWFEPDWPGELEGWWVLGYFGHGPAVPYAWPVNSTWYINYTAGSYLTIDYNAEPDPRPYYLEIDELPLADPYCTLWHEVYPDYCNIWHCISHDPVVIDNYITMEFDGLIRDFHITDIATDIQVLQKRCVQDIDPAADFYTNPITVDIAGYPHPEKDESPWFGRDYPIPLPNEVENAMYTACYKVLGRMIDLYVCDYPDGFNGRGPNVPADMFWPQKEVCLCAEVTYNLWPEQNKDVAFEVKDPYGEVYTVISSRTNVSGIAMACFRLPWTCDDPEHYFGEWKVTASVDVACEHINDTMTFKYDYMVHIWKVTVDPTSLAHGECFNATIEYGSWAMQYYEILIAVSGLDETGVPFDYGFVWITVGGARYCTYANGTASVMLCVPKWARAGRAEIHVNALWPGLPQDGGVQQYPVVIEYMTIRAE